MLTEITCLSSWRRAEISCQAVLGEKLKIKCCYEDPVHVHFIQEDDYCTCMS